MTTILTTLIVLASITLILVVLVQKSKGGGLSSNFSSSNSIMGVRKTTDFIEKITWGLAAFILVMSILVVVVSPKSVAPQSQIAPRSILPNNTTAPDMSNDFPLPLLPATDQPKGDTPAK